MRLIWRWVCRGGLAGLASLSIASAAVGVRSFVYSDHFSRSEMPPSRTGTEAHFLEIDLRSGGIRLSDVTVTRTWPAGYPQPYRLRTPVELHQRLRWQHTSGRRDVTYPAFATYAGVGTSHGGYGFVWGSGQENLCRVLVHEADEVYTGTEVILPVFLFTAVFAMGPAIVMVQSAWRRRRRQPVGFPIGE